MKNQGLETKTKPSRHCQKNCKKATYFAIELQDRKRNDSLTKYTEHPVTEEMYNHYWNQFIHLWGKRISIKDARGNAVDGFLKSLIAK